MQSRPCRERPAISGRCTGDYEAPRKQPGFVATDRQDQADNYFVAEDDDFLDAVSVALNQLTADCKAALQWSHNETDAEAAIQAAEQSFCTIASICKEAGIAVGADLVGDNDDVAVCRDQEHDSSASSRSLAGINTPSWTNGDDFHSDTSLHPPPVPVQIRVSAEPRQQGAALTPNEESVEVELTDLLTQSHEEMLGLQRFFDNRMSGAERARDEYELKHAEEVRSLQEEVASSRSTIDRMKQEILDNTTRKLEDMHSAIIASQRVIEAGMKEQARYWKSICKELVVEKRDMAQRVAEERGKYTALKAHLASHDENSTKPAPYSRVRIRSASGDDSIDNIRVCESPSPVPSLRREVATCNEGSNEESAACTSSSSTPTGSSSRLVIVPTADNVSESSSREVSPTYSSSSTNTSKTGRLTFRRYYLAQKRENRVVLQYQ